MRPLGSGLAGLMSQDGHDVTVIDKDPRSFLRLGSKFKGKTLTGSGDDREILSEAGVENADGLATVTESDEHSIVIARVNNPKNAWMFTAQIGVDVALNQAEIMSHMIAEEMSLGDMMTLLKLQKGKYSIVEEKIDPGAVAVDKAVKDLNLPEECVLVTIIRDGNLMIPRGNTVLKAKDEVISVVSKGNLKALAKIFGVV